MRNTDTSLRRSYKLEQGRDPFIMVYRGLAAEDMEVATMDYIEWLESGITILQNMVED